jgi:hypothetical protein
MQSFPVFSAPNEVFINGSSLSCVNMVTRLIYLSISTARGGASS